MACLPQTWPLKRIPCVSCSAKPPSLCLMFWISHQPQRIRSSLRCPYIMMTFISGFPLYNIWSGHHLNGTTPEMTNPRRVRALEGIAGAMLQLGKFSFKIGGCPFTACSNMSSLELYRLFQALLIKESRSSHPVCTLGKTISPRTLVVNLWPYPKFRLVGHIANLSLASKTVSAIP